MKKIARSIAVVLILVMLAISFTGCLTYWGRSHATLNRILYAVVDIVTLPVSLLCLLIYIIITEESGEAQSYLVNIDNKILNEYYSLYDKINSLPEAEFTSLMQILNVIPEENRISTIEILTSFPEEKLVSLAKAYKSLSENDIISSIERISAFSETEIISLLQHFNSLTEAELDSVIESINPRSKITDVAITDYPNSSFNPYFTASANLAVVIPLD